MNKLKLFEFEITLKYYYYCIKASMLTYVLKLKSFTNMSSGRFTKNSFNNKLMFAIRKKALYKDSLFTIKLHTGRIKGVSV